MSIQGQVAVLRKAHAMLSEHLELDSWAELWAAADGQQGFDAYSGRTALAVTRHLLTDLLPNFGFCEPTGRFARLVGSSKFATLSNDFCLCLPLLHVAEVLCVAPVKCT